MNIPRTYSNLWWRLWRRYPPDLVRRYGEDIVQEAITSIYALVSATRFKVSSRVLSQHLATAVREITWDKRGFKPWDQYEPLKQEMLGTVETLTESRAIGLWRLQSVWPYLARSEKASLYMIASGVSTKESAKLFKCHPNTVKRASYSATYAINTKRKRRFA